MGFMDGFLGGSKTKTKQVVENIVNNTVNMITTVAQNTSVVATQTNYIELVGCRIGDGFNINQNNSSKLDIDTLQVSLTSSKTRAMIAEQVKLETASISQQFTLTSQKTSSENISKSITNLMTTISDEVSQNLVTGELQSNTVKCVGSDIGDDFVLFQGNITDIIVDHVMKSKNIKEAAQETVNIIDSNAVAKQENIVAGIFGSLSVPLIIGAIVIGLIVLILGIIIIAKLMSHGR